MKGGGGIAFPTEKKVAKLIKQGKNQMTNDTEWIIISDSSKRVSSLGEKFAIPIAVRSEAIDFVTTTLFESFTALAVARRGKNDNDGNFILDVKVKPHDVQKEWEEEIESIPGVVCSGLFLDDYADQIWVTSPDGSIDIYLPEQK